MAITLTGAGGFFQRVLDMMNAWNALDRYRGPDLDGFIAALEGQYLAGEQAVFARIWTQRDGWRRAFSVELVDLFQLAADTLVEQADRDTTFPQKPTYHEAMLELVYQMKRSGDTIERPALAAAVTPTPANVGDTILMVTTTDGDSLPLDCVFAEQVRARVTAVNANAAFSESIHVFGDPAVNPSDFNWPAGSGTNLTITTTDPALNSGVQNGGFEQWAASNVPANWTIVAGVAGTEVLQGVDPKRGTNNLRLVASATPPKLRQTPSATLLPHTLYAVTFSAKVGALDATGLVRLALVDKDGAVVNDDANVPNSLAVGLNGGSGAGVAYKGFAAWFRTPAKVQTDWAFEVGFEGTPAAGAVVDVDLVGVSQPAAMYQGGPRVIAWGNSVSPVLGDSWIVDISNSLDGGSMVRSMDRAFGTRQMGVKIPTSLTPTIPM